MKITGYIALFAIWFVFFSPVWMYIWAWIEGPGRSPDDIEILGGSSAPTAMMFKVFGITLTFGSTSTGLLLLSALITLGVLIMAILSTRPI